MSEVKKVVQRMDTETREQLTGYLYSGLLRQDLSRAQVVPDVIDAIVDVLHASLRNKPIGKINS